MTLLMAVLILSATLAWVMLRTRSGGAPATAEPVTAPLEPSATGSPPPVVTEPPTVVTYTPIPSRPPVVPPTAAPPPTPAALPTTQVQVSGDDARVRLLSTAASGTLPAALPPGGYTIQADFGDGTFITVGRLELSGSDAVTVHCSARFLRCGVR